MPMGEELKDGRWRDEGESKEWRDRKTNVVTCLFDCAFLARTTRLFNQHPAQWQMRTYEVLLGRVCGHRALVIKESLSDKYSTIALRHRGSRFEEVVHWQYYLYNTPRSKHVDFQNNMMAFVRSLCKLCIYNKTTYNVKDCDFLGRALYTVTRRYQAHSSVPTLYVPSMALRAATSLMKPIYGLICLIRPCDSHPGLSDVPAFGDVTAHSGGVVAAAVHEHGWRYPAGPRRPCIPVSNLRKNLRLWDTYPALSVDKDGEVEDGWEAGMIWAAYVSAEAVHRDDATRWGWGCVSGAGRRRINASRTDLEGPRLAMAHRSAWRGSYLQLAGTPWPVISVCFMGALSCRDWWVAARRWCCERRCVELYVRKRAAAEREDVALLGHAELRCACAELSCIARATGVRMAGVVVRGGVCAIRGVVHGGLSSPCGGLCGGSSYGEAVRPAMRGIVVVFLGSLVLLRADLADAVQVEVVTCVWKVLKMRRVFLSNLPSGALILEDVSLRFEQWGSHRLCFVWYSPIIEALQLSQMFTANTTPFAHPSSRGPLFNLEDNFPP
ncbi:hypothetical protein C8R44DRAFT_906579 [Mycena epipterygia]|nr:hypothetical protein C8R44DRAFT_906579 [Mycena epipterygia]